jgi:adenosylhomocysteine nucleosidase
MSFSRERPLAISSPMHEELRALLPLVEDLERVTLAGREFHVGHIARQPVVLVLSGIGKVAAGATTALLLSHFNAGAVVFSGVAGGLGAGVRVGDIVVADSHLQHDMDCSPIFPRFEVPLTGTARFATDAGLNAELQAAAAWCRAPSR